MDSTVREKILSDPAAILADADVMRALIDANANALGENVIDLRGIVMHRLERRLDRLEDTHRSVIAAAYDNIAGTTQVHRAVLSMLEPRDFDTFLTRLETEVRLILRVESIKIVFEAHANDTHAEQSLEQTNSVIVIQDKSFTELYISQGTGGPRNMTTRAIPKAGVQVYGDMARQLKSEACIKLDLGSQRLPAMLCLASADPEKFSPQQGTDLLTFFGGVVERLISHWLS